METTITDGDFVYKILREHKKFLWFKGIRYYVGVYYKGQLVSTTGNQWYSKEELSEIMGERNAKKYFIEIGDA